MRASRDSADARRFYECIDAENLAPLWDVLMALVPPAPMSVSVPAHWSYASVRPHLDAAGRLISAEEAERRVLVMENPALRGQSSITRTLYAGYQLLLPKEVAHSHRHTATAVRLILEGTGACTSVDGEITDMEPGDFIITPSATFHDHSNPGDEAVVWLDGLDVPLIQLLEAGFSEKHPAAAPPLSRSKDDSWFRYGQNMLPAAGSAAPARNPIFRYPYAQTRACVKYLAAQSELDACHGVKQQFINPLTGGAATATMAAFMQWLPANFRSAAYRSTESTVFCVVEGCGTTQIGTRSFAWQPHDVFVVPSWTHVAHAPHSDAILYSFSDRPVLQALQVWKEERGARSKAVGMWPDASLRPAAP